MSIFMLFLAAINAYAAIGFGLVLMRQAYDGRGLKPETMLMAAAATTLTVICAQQVSL